MTHYESGTEPSSEYRAGCGGHMDVANVAQRANVGTLVLSHVLEHIDRPGIRERLIREVASVYSGRIIWAEDLMEIPISPGPSRKPSKTGSREW